MAWTLAIAGFGLAIQLWMIRPALDSRRWRFAIDLSKEGMIWGVVSILFFVGFFRNALHLVPILIVAVMVHEYGHVLAYRLAGHRDPKFRLFPFGGVAMSGERPRSQVENAYVSLMGPGFSLTLLIAAVVAAFYLASTGDAYGANYAWAAAFWIGLLNAFNLLPFYPLDGGQTLRAVAMTFGAKFGKAVTIAMSAAFGAFAIAYNLWFLLLFAVIGVASALRPDAYNDRLPKMNAGACILVLVAYAATFAAHAYMVWLYLT